MEEGNPFSQVQCWGRDSTESHRQPTIPALRETEPHAEGEVSAEGQTEAGARAVRQSISPKCETMSFRFCLPWTSHPHGLNAPISGKENPLQTGWGPAADWILGGKKTYSLFLPGVFLPGEFHGQGSLAGYSPWGCKESDMTLQLTHTHKI